MIQVNAFYKQIGMPRYGSILSNQEKPDRTKNLHDTSPIQELDIRGKVIQKGDYVALSVADRSDIPKYGKVVGFYVCKVTFYTRDDGQPVHQNADVCETYLCIEGFKGLRHSNQVLLLKD